MDNLHRALAPISDAAWKDIEEEARRTLCRYMGARHVVDIGGPRGYDFSAANLGHLEDIDSAFAGVETRQRLVRPLIELKVPFTLSRQAIDDVARGSRDSDWQPLKDAALKLASAEDQMVFEGFGAAGIDGMRQLSSNPAVPMPKDAEDIPQAVAEAVELLRRAGVEGPYALVLGDDVYAEVAGGSDDGFPLMRHLRNLVDCDVIWSPALKGGIVLSLRGGDFDLYLGLDASIGYLSHDAQNVTLYFLETVAFQLQTAEALVSLPVQG